MIRRATWTAALSVVARAGVRTNRGRTVDRQRRDGRRVLLTVGDAVTWVAEAFPG